jgi:hypothetical protein
MAPAAFAVGVVASWHQPAGELALVVRSAAGGPPLISLPLTAGERFTLRYLHSVNGTPVWEEHYADATGDIYLSEERCIIFGAGMGHWPGHGTLVGRDSLQVIEHIDRRLGEFVVRVGDHTCAQTIVCGEHSLRLSDLAPDQAVLIAAVPTSWLARLRRLMAQRSPVIVLAEQ